MSGAQHGLAGYLDQGRQFVNETSDEFLGWLMDRQSYQTPTGLTPQQEIDKQTRDNMAARKVQLSLAQSQPSVDPRAIQGNVVQQLLGVPAHSGVGFRSAASLAQMEQQLR